MTGPTEADATAAWARLECALGDGDHAAVLRAIIDYVGARGWVDRPDELVPAVREAVDGLGDPATDDLPLAVRALAVVGDGIPDATTEAAGDLLERAHELGATAEAPARSWAASALVSLGRRDEELGRRDRANERYEAALDLVGWDDPGEAVEDWDDVGWVARGVRLRALWLLTGRRDVVHEGADR